MSDWSYHGHTTDVNPRSAYEALVKIGYLVDESDGEVADVELGQIYSAIKNGAESEMDEQLKIKLGLAEEHKEGEESDSSDGHEKADEDEENKKAKIFRQLVEQYEKDHIHFLIDKGHVFDRGSGENCRKLSLSNQGRSVVDYDRRDETGKARRLFIESLESTQANTFRYGATTQNDTKRGIRPLAHLAQALQKSEQDELDIFQAAEAIFDSADSESVADRIDSLSEMSQEERKEEYGKHDQLDDAKALFAEAVNHPAFYWTDDSENRTLHVRDETALNQLTDQHDGIAPDQYRTMDRAVGRTIQGQPGLRMADLTSIRGIGEKTERAFYRTLADKCSDLRADDPDERRHLVGQKLKESVTEALPSNVEASDVYDATNIQEHDYEQLYRGELQAMRESVEYILGEPDEVSETEKIEVVEGVLDDEGELLSENIGYFCGQTDELSYEPSSPKDGYEALLGCESFSRRLYYERARQGAADEEIKDTLDYLYGYYNSDKGVEENLMQVLEKTRYPLPEREKALVLEDFFGLSLVAMADEDQEIERNLKTTRTPFGVHGSSVAPGKNPDTSAIVEAAKHFTGEITGLNNARELYERELEAILRHAEKYAKDHDLDPETVPVLFVAANGLGADSSALDGLARAYQSNSKFNTNPVPLNLLTYRFVFEAVQDNDTSLEELYDFLQEVGKTFKFYAKYGYSIEEWAERARDQIVDHIKDDGTISTERPIQVDLPTSRHSDGETRYCTVRTSELPNMTYEYMLEQYHQRLEADLSHYEEQDATAAENLQNAVWVDPVRERFGDVDLTPAGFKLLLDDYGDKLDEAIKRKNKRRYEENEEESKADNEQDKERKGQESVGQRDEQTEEHKALQTIEALLGNCSDDVLRGEEGIDFQVDLQFWRDRIIKSLDGVSNLNKAELKVVERFAQDGFVEWFSELDTVKQKRTALYLHLAGERFETTRALANDKNYEAIESILSEASETYGDIRQKNNIEDLAEYKKWQEVNYWHRNFPDVFDKHIKPILEDDANMSYKRFLRDMSKVLKDQIEASIKAELEELIERYDGDREAVYNELKKQFEDEQLQQLAQQAKAVLNRPIELNSDDDRDFKNKLEDVVSIMASEAERSFDLEKLDTSELRSYYEQLREEFERSKKQKIER